MRATKKIFPNLHPNDPQFAFNRAVKYLSLRARSVHEVEQYLFKKDYTPKVVASTIERLLDLKYLNDEEFGKTYLRSKQLYRGKSKYFISYELKQKGLDPDLIKNLSSEAQDDLNTAKTFIQRKKRVYAALDKQKFKEKMMRLLSSRGFSYDTIKKALSD